MSDLFQGIFNTSLPTVPVTDFLLCLGVSLLTGLLLALAYTFRTRYTKSFLITLAVLPAVVCMVIMMVNGNIGAGVAVAGAFSLVRFRSVPGTAKEICVIFLAMGSGLIAGMGYLGYSVLFTLIMCAALILYTALDMGEKKAVNKYRVLTVTVPEDLNYTEVFDDILKEYASQYTLTKVKTSNMGSMFKLTYSLTLRDPAKEKELIDAIRCRNGNLEVALAVRETVTAEL